MSRILTLAPAGGGVSARILTATLTNKATCRRARKYFADRNLLSEFQPLASRGYYLFTLYVPPHFCEAGARRVFSAAFPLERLDDATFQVVEQAA